MNRCFTHFAIAACALLVVFFGAVPNGFAKRIYMFGGGPAGSDYLYLAGGVATDNAVKSLESFRILAGASEGSADNLKKVDDGRFAFGVVYSGDLYHGWNGTLPNEPKKITHALAVGCFFGSPVQLAVNTDTGIQSATDLVGKSVNVGVAGSRSTADAELFFRHLGIWDHILRSAMDDTDAATVFGNQKIDAFWLMAAFPSDAVTVAAQNGTVSLIDVQADAERTGFLKKYPYFSKATIPAGTYPGIDHAVGTFEEPLLWVANDQVPAAMVYTLLEKIYSPEGLAHMTTVKKVAQTMTLQNGIQGITTPMHPGAIRFWKENGVLR